MAALFVLLLGRAVPALGDITVGATVQPQRARVGESVMLAITVTGAQDVTAPALGNLEGFSARYVGPSTQISFVNGRISASVEHRYALLAERPGRFTLGPFSVDYQGKSYSTPSLTVDVAAAAAPAAGADASPVPARSGVGDALRLELTTPQQEVYVHQRLQVDATLYVGPVRVGDVQYPTLAGDAFSIEKFPEPTQRQEQIGGTTYQVVRFQTSVIPLRSGSLTLGPATLRLSILERQRRGGPFDDPFFEPFMSARRPFDLRSDPISLTVLPLPEAGRPADFSGAVGTFTMEAVASPTDVRVGDPVTVHVEIAGVGSLGDSAPPVLSRPEGFRAYDAHLTASETRGSEVSRRFEQVLIASEDTITAIPPLRFSFFDPGERRYHVLESAPIALRVSPAEGSGRTEIIAGTQQRLAPPEALGRDIVYIKDDPGRLLNRGGKRWVYAFWLWQPMPFAVLLLAFVYDRRRQRLSGDLRYARFTRAAREARRALSEAEGALRQHERQAFYDLVSHAMQTYLSAKLDVPLGAIDAETIAARPLPPDCRNRITQFFETCEQIRFAPGSNDGDMRGTLELAREIVKRLERERYVA
jgi:hypothetical protein